MQFLKILNKKLYFKNFTLSLQHHLILIHITEKEWQQRKHGIQSQRDTSMFQFEKHSVSESHV